MAPAINNISAVLRRAAEIVKRGWTQRIFARNSMGDAVTSCDSLAVKWCLWGAIHKATDGRGVDRKLVALVAEKLGNGALWNDSPDRTQAEVVAKLQELATIAEQEDK